MDVKKQGDLGTPERHARGELGKEVVEGVLIAKVRNISPIHTMYKREQITASQFSAGDYMYRCYVKAWVGIKALQTAERIDGCKAPEMSDSQVHAMHQYLRGIAAAGLEKQLVIDVCCDEKYISSLAKTWRKRAELKARLKLALDDVAKQFGF